MRQVLIAVPAVPPHAAAAPQLPPPRYTRQHLHMCAFVSSRSERAAAGERRRELVGMSHKNCAELHR